MSERYGRWMAALIIIVLLLTVLVIFSTVDLGLDENIFTDVSSAPILTDGSPTPQE